MHHTNQITDNSSWIQKESKNGSLYTPVHQGSIPVAMVINRKGPPAGSPFLIHQNQLNQFTLKFRRLYVRVNMKKRFNTLLRISST